MPSSLDKVSTCKGLEYAEYKLVAEDYSLNNMIF